MMRKPYPRYLLSGKEFDALEKLARRSKIDCWFSLEDVTDPVSGISHTVVYDLERRHRVSLQYGVRLLLEGSSPLEDMKEDYGLSRTEVSAIGNLAKKLGV